MKKQNKTERTWLCRVWLPQQMSLISVGIRDFKECGSKCLALPDEQEMEEWGRRPLSKSLLLGLEKQRLTVPITDYFDLILHETT